MDLFWAEADYLRRPHNWIDTLRNIATVLGSIFIPFAITYSARARERKKSTVDIIRRSAIDPDVTTRFARLHQHRLHEAYVGDPADRPSTPFETQDELVRESVFVLNLCDSISIELAHKLISRTILFRTLGATHIGANDVILKRLEADLGMDLRDALTDFRRTVRDIEEFGRSTRTRFVSRIPPTTKSSPQGPQ